MPGESDRTEWLIRRVFHVYLIPVSHKDNRSRARLATAFKRIGLVEQTGRGVDRIFKGQLRYGRPAPDYARSDTSGVRVILNGDEPSLKFASFVYEEDKQNGLILQHSSRRWTHYTLNVSTVDKVEVSLPLLLEDKVLVAPKPLFRDRDEKEVRGEITGRISRCRAYTLTK